MAFLQFLMIIPVVLALVLRMINQIFAWSYFRRYKILHNANNTIPTVSVIVPVRGLDMYAV